MISNSLYSIFHSIYIYIYDITISTLPLYLIHIIFLEQAHLWCFDQTHSQFFALAHDIIPLLHVSFIRRICIYVHTNYLSSIQMLSITYNIFQSNLFLSIYIIIKLLILFLNLLCNCYFYYPIHLQFLFDIYIYYVYTIYAYK